MLRSVPFFLVWISRCVASFFPDNPQKIATATLEGEPTALVAGCVYTLSGDYCETAVDLCIQGIEPLPFQRTFTSFWDGGTFLGGWSANTQCFFESEGGYYAFTQEHGGKVYFSAESKLIIPECFSAGLTNCSGGVVGGQYDWKNARINPFEKGGEVTLGDGTRYLFDRRKLKVFNSNGTTLLINDPFNKSRRISLRGMDGQIVGTIRWNKDSDSLVTVEGSNGQKVIYRHQLGKSVSRFEIEAKHLPLIQYLRSEVKKGEPYGRIEKRLPEGRFLWVDHYRRGSYGIDPKVSIGGSDDPCYGRVASLKEPAGEDGSPIETYRFVYHPDKHQTDVYNAYEQLTRYQGDECNRLCTIAHYTGKNPYKLYGEERLFWGRQGRLRCRALLDGNGKPLFALHYKYDKFGNVVTETLWGNLTGQGNKSLQINLQGIPSGGENCQRHFSYSEDEFRLKLSEKNRQNHIFYRYLSGTNKLAAKWISDKKKIRLRTFYIYNEKGFLVEEIQDDGSSENRDELQEATERHIFRFSNTPEGWPLRKEEFYFDFGLGQEILVCLKCYSYDRCGRKTVEEKRDGEGHLLSKQQWSFDARGRLIKEIDPLGQIKEYRYDENGNKILEKGPDPELITRFSYDYSNRLTRVEKTERDGTLFSATNRYYYTHQKYSSTDFNGETTRYRYDDVGRLDRVQYPSIEYEGQAIHPTEQFEYDVQGFITKHVACDGGVTLKDYTIRGKPLRIEYPDGGGETFNYNLIGELVQCTAKDGVITTIHRDFLGRPTLEEIHSPEGVFLSKTERSYNAFHLLTEKGGDGIETTYHYDGAGRLEEKRIGPRKILYFYNALGQLIRERDFFGEGAGDFMETTRRYDLLGRLLEERDFTSWETHTYDPAGYRASTTTLFGKKSSTVTYQYDALGRILEERDDKGEKTVYCYDGLQKTITNPAGYQRVEFFSPQGCLLKVEQYDPRHQLILSQSWTYDKAGRKLSQRDGEKKNHQWSWEYDLMGNLVTKIEGDAAPLQKKQMYQYDIAGRKIKWIKSDGVSIHYSYDFLSRLSELKSSDETIHYRYFYNRQHRLEKVVDFIHATESIFKWDKQGFLSQEMLANGLSISYRNDWHGKVLEVIFPDKSGIDYLYEKGLLNTVSRKSAEGKILYQHTYMAWNKQGFPLKMLLPGSGGEVTYIYNTEGNLIKIDSKHYQEDNLRYDTKGNLCGRSINGTAERYQYDSLAHLIGELGGEKHHYSYDPLGNRLKCDGRKEAVNALNQLTKQGAAEYIYDPCGRMIYRKEGSPQTSFQYDALDRLIEVNCNGQKIRYTYDYAHRRLVKEVDGLKTFFLYQGQNEVGEQDEKGDWTNLRILGAGRGAEIGAAIGIELEGVPHIPIHSSTGSLALLLDLKGEIAESYHTTAFGEEGSNAYKNPWRFSSKRIDSETAFIFFGRRYYIPQLGRWLTPDPLEEQGSANLYAFVSANPLNHIDLYGLSVERPSLFQKLAKAVGSLLKGVGDHLVPLPHIRDAISALGHRLKGGSRLNFRELCRNPHSTVGFVPAPRPENGVSVSYICGILNRPEDCAATADLISKQYGGAPVHFCYNSSEGLACDLLESFAQLIGIKTCVVETAAHMLRERIQAVGSEGKVHLHLHSQGGIIGYRALQQLTPAEKKLIHVTTYGTTKHIPSREVGSSLNVIAKNDPVPWLADPLGSLRSYWGHSDTLKVIPSPRSALTSHSIHNYLNTLKTCP